MGEVVVFNGIRILPRFRSHSMLEKFTNPKYDPRESVPLYRYMDGTPTREYQRHLLECRHWLAYQLDDFVQSFVRGEWERKYAYLRRKVGEVDVVLGQITDIDNEIIGANVPLVRHLVKKIPLATRRRLCKMGHDFADLVSEGCIEMLKVVEGFDLTRGFELSTPVGEYIRNRAKNLDEQIRCKKRGYFHGKISIGSEFLPEEILAGKSQNPINSLHAKEVVNSMRELDPLLKRVIEERYWNGLSQGETGEALGVTRRQVGILEKQALDLLRERLQAD